MCGLEQIMLLFWGSTFSSLNERCGRVIVLWYLSSPFLYCNLIFTGHMGTQERLNFSIFLGAGYGLVLKFWSVGCEQMGSPFPLSSFPWAGIRMWGEPSQSLWMRTILWAWQSSKIKKESGPLTTWQRTATSLAWTLHKREITSILFKPLFF